ncbi:hypothetical protein [Erwinia sorbitola]|nr:hypothetical protein [Erwinia sorbitola]MTD28822.1 hypothetical protein [Erwinia sorbitola]
MVGDVYLVARLHAHIPGGVDTRDIIMKLKLTWKTMHAHEMQEKTKVWSFLRVGIFDIDMVFIFGAFRKINAEIIYFVITSLK